MLKYATSRWTYFSECGKHSEKHSFLKWLVFIIAVYDSFARIQAVVQFPVIELVLPKLPIPWALTLVLAAICWLLIEGGYRRSQMLDSEKRRELEEFRQAMVARDDEINRLTWPPDRPKLSFHSWGQRQPESVLAGTNQTTLFFQRGFHLSNDGGVALEATVERFVIDDKFSAFGSTVARIEGGTQSFIPIILENKPQMEKYALDHALSLAWEKKVNSKELAFNQPLVILVSVVYRDFNDLWYRSSAGLIFTHVGKAQIGGIEFAAGTHRIEFTAVKQERLGTTPPY